ncbi:hypothetical protein FDECE_344 [Fusarium decemcellulare]|nr:hypothetical protein FDECE_344 [Fusarium decemcellulare]
MSTPRVKRQFAGAAADPSQRQITSFFNAKSPNDPVIVSEVPREPALPSTVQANLLSVGMRVRKSVPEGYKTAGTSAFKIWTDNAPVAASTVRATPTKVSSRELLPFCGINKVGGLDTQPDFEQDDVPGLDAIPELTMSQETAESIDSHESSRKRIFDDDDDELYVEPGFLTGATATQGLSRVYATPVSRTQKAPNLNGNVATGCDFDEAEFLVTEPEMELAD